MRERGTDADFTYDAAEVAFRAFAFVAVRDADEVAFRDDDEVAFRVFACMACRACGPTLVRLCDLV